MAYTYKLLRERMRETGFNAGILSEKLNKEFKSNHTSQYVSNCMCGRIAWRLPEVYAIMRWLDIPKHEIHLFFPEDGLKYNEPPQKPAEKISQEDAQALAAAVLKLVKAVG